MLRQTALMDRWRFVLRWLTRWESASSSYSNALTAPVSGPTPPCLGVPAPECAAVYPGRLIIWRDRGSGKSTQLDSCASGW